MRTDPRVKIASDLRKPAGMVVIERGHGAAFIQSLPIEKLWGVGPKFRERLRTHALNTVADVAALSRSELQIRSCTDVALGTHQQIVYAKPGSPRCQVRLIHSSGLQLQQSADVAPLPVADFAALPKPLELGEDHVLGRGH